MFQKLEEYKMAPWLAHIVLIDPDVAEAIHRLRAEGGAWQYVTVRGLESAIWLPEIACALGLGTLYEGLTFQSRPRVLVDI